MAEIFYSTLQNPPTATGLGPVWKAYGRAHPLSNGRVGVRHG